LALLGVFQNVNLVSQPKPKRIRSIATLPPLFSCRVGRSAVLQCPLVGCFLQAGFLPPSIIGRGSLRVPLEVGNATRQPSMGGADPTLTTREGETMRSDVMMHFLWPLHTCTVLSGCPLIVSSCVDRARESSLHLKLLYYLTRRKTSMLIHGW
jgi:hypothetical protein